MTAASSAYELIVDHQIVLSVFRAWPSFHDGEVLRLLLDRTRRSDAGAFVPSIELWVRGWNMTRDVTEQGFYRLENDSVVHLLFEGVSDVELDGLNHQNVLSGLDLEALSAEDGNAPTLAVELNHCYGLSGGFKAIRARVVAVEPYRV